MQTVCCWYSGMGIYDAIKSHGKITFIGRQLCSMGTVIIQAATRRLITDNSAFMVHWGTSEISGYYLSSQNLADFEKYTAQQMIEIYAERCQKTESILKNVRTTYLKLNHT